ncbi:MAG: oligosaccharide flippase family protein [Novosphingobium sp.]|nr:oligosaccharide flippase family protein [Novosphingobium sp.]
MNALLAKFRNAPGALVSVMRNFGWMLASRGLAAVFSLIYLAIITRSLGVSGFGKFALITGAAQMLANLLAFQTWQIIVQYGVNHIENNDENRLARLYRAAILLDVVSAVAGIAAAAIILHFFADELGMTETLARATLIFNIIMLFSLRSTPLGIMRLRDKFSLAAAAESALPTLRLIGAVAVYFIHPKLQGFLIAWAIAELLTAAAHWLAVRKIGDFKLLFQSGENVRAVLDDNPGILRYALTTNFSQSLFMSAKQIPLFLVGGLTGTAAAGAFRLAAQLSRSLTILSQMIARAAFPEIVRAVRNRGVGGLAAMVMQTIKVAFAVSAVVFVLVAMFGRLVLETVGGSDFGQGYTTLLWLAGAACVELVVVAFEPSIAAAQRAHLAFLARLVATAVMIGGSLLLVPTMGADGVAAAVFANSVTQAVLLGLILVHLVRKGEYIPPAPPQPKPSRDAA